ncbi:MAG: hypothetical protein ACPGVO_11345 [Spirulinaceae cyanobacterium]
MTQLIYPHLLYFGYHLQAASPNETWTQWRQAQAQFQKQQAESETSPIKYAHQDWEARYEEKDLGDTIGLWLMTAAQDKTTPQSSEFVARLKQKLDPIQSNLDQTWLVIGQQPPDTAAKEIITAIRALWPANPLGVEQSGSFLGNDLSTFSLENNQQLVILLAPDAARMNHIAHFYYELQRLFYYQHKVNWSRVQSRKIKATLTTENFFPLTAETIPANPSLTAQLNADQALNADLKQLRGILYNNMLKLDRHTRGIEGLSLQLETLKTNLNAYETRLNRIQQLTENREKYAQASDLKLWLDWLADATPIYEEQIHQDIASLQPGLKVREQHISTLRAIIEAAQAERDRAFQLFVESAGMGLGTAGFASSIVPPILDAYAQENPDTTTPITVGITHAGIAVAIGVIFASITYLLRRRSNRTR